MVVKIIGKKLQRCLSVIGASAAFLGLAANVAQAQDPHPARVRTSPDAFLHYQVYSTDDLIASVKKDPKLLAQYAKHYGVSQQRVLEFFSHSLIVYQLPKGRWVTNYGLKHNTGRIYSVRTYLKPGTPVWATRSGLPLLKWACANPLTKELPGTLLSIPPSLTRTTYDFKQQPGPDIADILAMAPQVELADNTAPMLLAPIGSQPFVIETPGGGQGAALPSAVVSGGSKLPGALALLPLALVATTIHHNSAPPVITNFAAPEPGSLALAVTAGIPALGIALARRRRK